MLKKCILLVFCSILALGLRSEELKIITNTDGLQGIADSKGEVIVPAVYERLGWSDGTSGISGQNIGYFENGKWGLINIRNGKLIGARYAILKPFGTELYEAGITGRFTNLIFRGLIDEKGKVHLSFKFYTLTRTEPDRIIVSEYVDGRLKYGLYTNGNMAVIDPEFSSMDLLGNFYQVSDWGNKIKLYNRNGQLLTESWVDDVQIKDDSYLVLNDGYHGLLNSTGQWVYPTKYKEITATGPIDFPNWEIRKLGNSTGRFVNCDSLKYDQVGELFIAHVNQAEHLLAASEALFSDQTHELKHLDNGFLVTRNRQTGKWGIYKTDGREVVTGFDSIAVDSAYFYALTKSGWDIYNLFGRKINDRSFQRVAASQLRNIPVKKHDVWGWIDFQGEQLIPFRYDELKPVMSSQHFLAKNYGKWGVSNFTDQWVIMPEYDSLYRFDNFYLATKGRSYRIFNLAGQLLHKLPYVVEVNGFLKLLDQDQKVGAVTNAGSYIHPQYEEIETHEGYYELRSSTGLSMVDMNNRIVFSEQDSITDVLAFSEGFFEIIKDGKYGFIDINGKLRIANRYDSAVQFNDGLAPVKLLNKWGFIDQRERLIIQPYYASATTFINDLAVVQIGSKYGIIDREGDEIIQTEWNRISRLKTGNYLVTNDSNKKGLADAVGRFIIRPDFDWLEDTDKSLIIAEKSGRRGVIDYQGFTRVPFAYKQIKIEGDYLLLRKE